MWSGLVNITLACYALQLLNKYNVLILSIFVIIIVSVKCKHYSLFYRALQIYFNWINTYSKDRINDKWCDNCSFINETIFTLETTYLYTTLRIRFSFSHKYITPPLKQYSWSNLLFNSTICRPSPYNNCTLDWEWNISIQRDIFPLYKLWMHFTIETTKLLYCACCIYIIHIN